MENLVKLIRTFPTDVTFEPENEGEPVLLDILPEEILVLIISNLDPTSVERFVTVSRKARLVCLDVGIWRWVSFSNPPRTLFMTILCRVLVLSTYRPPQIPDHEKLLTTLESYHFDYKRLFIEQPRVRLDGVYIVICHYVWVLYCSEPHYDSNILLDAPHWARTIRWMFVSILNRGWSFLMFLCNANQISHLVTYHRYL